MPRLFLEFWRLRQQALPEEIVRGGSRRPRRAPWSLTPDVKERLRPLLEGHGFDVAQDIVAREPAGENGFDLTQ